jgi:hypothetical protein
MLTRREVLRLGAQASLALGIGPLIRETRASGGTVHSPAMRCINVVNFLRGSEPRSAVDLLLPAQEQMKLIVARRLPATWLLQFDALVAGPFVSFLRAKMPADHEVGFWFEMCEKLCRAAEVAWRGRPGVEWDGRPAVAFTIGYTPAERVRLADAAIAGFKNVWGRFPKSVGSWNFDSVTLAYLTEQYGIDAFSVCRDQVATDGFTIWGAPIAGYFPSKSNLWSPAVDPGNQINTPIFRMLGQDPVYYYDNVFKLPDGKVVHEPDTMEPVWVSGQSRRFVQTFLGAIAQAPALRFAYAQLGQENNFGWPAMAAAYPMQMDALARLRDAGSIFVETMGESGRRFKRAFATTPAQAQVVLEDPFGNTGPAQRSVWYQSRFYRANLHVKGDVAFLRDLTVYSDGYRQPFLKEATREDEVQQRMLAILDGYHWRKEAEAEMPSTAGGFFQLGGKPMRIVGPPVAREDGDELLVDLAAGDGRVVHVRFGERTIRVNATGARDVGLALAFVWEPSKAALAAVAPDKVSYRWQGIDYGVRVLGGSARATKEGWMLEGDGSEIGLDMVLAGSGKS